MPTLFDRMMDFEHTHGNKIALTTSIGEIELEFRTQAGDREEDRVYAELFQDWLDLPYDEPARNKASHFKAVLLRDGKPVAIAYEVTAESAVRALFVEDARRRMDAELMTPPAEEINY